MDKTISAAEANRAFSRLLKDVRKGESYTVTSHGEPVARIVPAGEETRESEKVRRDAAWQALLARLRSQPAMNSGQWSRDEAHDDDL
ncbi:MAG TPA: type II toxin-antitoxin system prevent-host-death family antitoxin [Rhizomicrobium sp.]|nr:type II toxin-antitoxin system prevent-host-death family antitoxin [Rhizomicrobium sp.]